MLDVTIFRQVGCGCVFQFSTNQPIRRITSPKLRIEVPAELALMPCASFFWLRLTMKGVEWLRFTMKGVHEGFSLAGLLGNRTPWECSWQDVGFYRFSGK
jgi:hypothetical protein